MESTSCKFFRNSSWLVTAVLTSSSRIAVWRCCFMRVFYLLTIKAFHATLNLERAIKNLMHKYTVKCIFMHIALVKHAAPPKKEGASGEHIAFRQTYSEAWNGLLHLLLILCLVLRGRLQMTCLLLRPPRVSCP